jgi:hypothetical protein
VFWESIDSLFGDRYGWIGIFRPIHHICLSSKQAIVMIEAHSTFCILHHVEYDMRNVHLFSRGLGEVSTKLPHDTNFRPLVELA